MTLTAPLRAAVQQQVLRRPAAAPSPTAPALWVDMSNYSGALTDGMLDDLQAAGYVGAIVQAITGNDGASYTRQQLDALTRRGLRIAGYVWCFPGAAPSSMQGRLAMFDGYRLEFLALDVEQVGLSRADVDRDLAICDLYARARTWVYSAFYFFKDQGWLNETRWADRPLWFASYDDVPELTPFTPFGGWTTPRAKQFMGTSTIGRLHMVDLNIVT